MGPTPAVSVAVSPTGHAVCPSRTGVIAETLAPHFCVYRIVALRGIGALTTNVASIWPAGIVMFVNGRLNICEPAAGNVYVVGPPACCGSAALAHWYVMVTGAFTATVAKAVVLPGQFAPWYDGGRMTAFAIVSLSDGGVGPPTGVVVGCVVGVSVGGAVVAVLGANAGTSPGCWMPPPPGPVLSVPNARKPMPISTAAATVPA